MNTFTKIGITVCFFMFCFSMYMTCRELVRIRDDEKAKKVWLNKEHTACHFQDTLEINGVKYLKVYDKDNAGYYGSPYLVEVK